VAENVNPKAGRRTGLVIGIIAVVVVLVLIFFYWMGAWQDTGAALDPDPVHDPRIEQQPVAPQPTTPQPTP
jgi:hypothetical protein